MKCSAFQRIFKRAGFTLIELLVVIAIIAILAAILFPIFTDAKKAGMKTRCLSNCKQIAVGLSLYKDSWNGCWPSCYSQEDYAVGKPNYDTVYGHAFWMNRIDPYIKSRSVFRCPSAKEAFPSKSSYYVAYGRTGVLSHFAGADYGANEYLIETVYTSGTGTAPWIKETALKYPSKTALIADCNFPTFWGQDTTHAMSKGPDGQRWPEGMLRIKYPECSWGSYTSGKTRHGGFTTIIYTDLHTKSVPTNDITMVFTPTLKQNPIISPAAEPL